MKSSLKSFFKILPPALLLCLLSCGKNGGSESPEGGQDKEETVEIEIKGTLVRTSTADPCLLYKDGFFYMTMTGSSNLAMVVDREIPKLSTAFHPIDPSIYIYQSSADPSVEALYGEGAKINGTWSPEIHYLSEEDCPGNSGWYLLFAIRKENLVNGSVNSEFIRMVVLKSLTGSPRGPWVNPVDGTVGKTQPLLTSDGKVYTDWGCGQSLLKIPSGKHKGIYITWVAEEGRGQGYGKFYQKLMIAKMKSPWQMDGEPAILTTPTQDWEKAGASSTLPMVVEGGTAVYGDKGEIFMAYCGSGYWSDYGLGQLTLLRDSDGDYADPTVSGSWVKYENNPVFSSKNSADLRGAGHAFFLKDAEGKRFMCYHAYPYKDGTKSSSRNAYMESYEIDSEAVCESAPYGVLRFGLRGDGQSASTGTAYTFSYLKR